MNYLEVIYKIFDRQSIDSTNNAIECILDTQYTVRSVDEYFFY